MKINHKTHWIEVHKNELVSTGEQKITFTDCIKQKIPVSSIKWKINEQGRIRLVHMAREVGWGQKGLYALSRRLSAPRYYKKSRNGNWFNKIKYNNNETSNDGIFHYLGLIVK